jgi:hypothetical protein
MVFRLMASLRTLTWSRPDACSAACNVSDTSLELCKAAEDGQHQPPVWGGCIGPTVTQRRARDLARHRLASVMPFTDDVPCAAAK